MSLFSAVPGAVVEDGVLIHTGNPMAEQRALQGGRAVAPLEDRAVLTATGEDRLSWLDSVTSQALAHLPAGQSTELLVLDPNGHIEHAAAVLDDGETTWLIVDRADAQSLLAWLTRMRFRMRVELVDATESHTVIGGTAEGVHAATSPAVSHAVPLVWEDPWPSVSAGGWAYAADEGHPGFDREWVEAIVTREEATALAARAVAGEVTVAGTLAADALRVAAWRPGWRTEVDERALPHESDWLRTSVHLNKGCYRGQETVAKVHNLGHPPRRLVALQLDGSGDLLPLPGAEVREGDRSVGVLTSVARHHEEGPIALALVRRTTDIDAVLFVETENGSITAAQEMIVPPDAGATASVPRITRLSRRARAT
ncbi:folate-binding protein YgfZ [Microbacterium sp. C7(2022)]|uniref:CAF17-like 4Fe-4S cluster assembly/insertion protein YgfZ n=1 Tax=Microbacterium sp. C7(2022) TaxID=2992759 RepID=UPI00237ADCE7|nr:glycine cleavage T C-terminal barrel domain-containing protein [Microbacterium sp. C7(2022)]MDE0547140.1 folate-binding protein [Microbacterium sp. C7(2022)]